MTFNWGFSDGQAPLLPDADIVRFYAEGALLKPKWWRISVPWMYMQPTAGGPIDWSWVDKAIQPIVDHGIKPILVFGFKPAFGSVLFLGQYLGGRPPTAAEFADFAHRVADHYKDRCFVYEIWNEPNNAAFWGTPITFFNIPAVEPAMLADYQKQGYTAIKAISALAGTNSTILAPGMMALPVPNEANQADPANNFIGKNSLVMTPYDAIDSLYKNGCKGFMDGIAHHPYTDPTYGGLVPPDISTAGSMLMNAKIYNDIMVPNGDGGLKIWWTEFGFNAPAVTGTNAVNPVSLADQQRGIQEVLEYGASLSYSGPMLMYCFRDINDFYGAITTDWQHKEPVYSYLKGLTPSGLDGTRIISMAGSGGWQLNKPAAGIRAEAMAGSGALLLKGVLGGAGAMGFVGSGELSLAGMINGALSMGVTGSGHTQTLNQFEVTGSRGLAVAGTGGLVRKRLVDGSLTATLGRTGGLIVAPPFNGAATETMAGSGTLAIVRALASTTLASVFAGSGTWAKKVAFSNTPNNPTLDTTLYGQWGDGVHLDFFGSAVENDHPGGANGTYDSGMFAKAPCETPWQYSECGIWNQWGSAERGNGPCVGGDVTFDNVVYALVCAFPGLASIYTRNSGGAGVSRGVTSTTLTVAAADRVGLRRELVGSDCVYTVSKNGTDTSVQWVDVGGATFGSTGRYCGWAGRNFVSNGPQNWHSQGWVGPLKYGDF